MFTTRVRSQGRILDFDIENRPLTYWWGDACTAEITAIAWSWMDDELVQVYTLDPPPNHENSMLSMLTAFRAAYESASLVTGHYIRGGLARSLHG
jgi:hypothetical protein